jgi:putative salt-induced outer membrane protein
MARYLAISFLFCVSSAFAQSPTAESVPASSPWKNESELSAVIVSGNTDSQSTSFKQKTSYTFEQNTLVAKGRYLSTLTSGTTTARAWDASGRYERALSNYWSVYTGYGSESDIFAGYVQRDSFDLGGKYFFIKKENQEFIGEAGYRNTHTYLTPPAHKYENFGRLFSQYTQKLSKTSDAKLWLEYLPNFTNSDAYLFNAEPSLSAALSTMFSVKMSYLLKYQGVVPAGFTEHLDTTYSTALVANW